MQPKSAEIQIGFKDPLVVDTPFFFCPYEPSTTEDCKWNNPQVLNDEVLRMSLLLLIGL